MKYKVLWAIGILIPTLLAGFVIGLMLDLNGERQTAVTMPMTQSKSKDSGSGRSTPARDTLGSSGDLVDDHKKEAIVFLRRGNLWTMGGDGQNQRQVTKEGVGHFSVSTDGTIVYDRFRPYETPGPLTDLNIYMYGSRDSAVKKLTIDNRSMRPVVSPDGRKIAFQKFLWGGQPNYLGSGKGTWIIDLATGKQEELLGRVSVPNAIKQERNKLQALAKKEDMDETKWLYDGDFSWSADSKSLMLLRTYEQGGVVRFYIDLNNQQQPITPPNKFNPFGKDLYKSKMVYFDNPSFCLYLYDFVDRTSFVLERNVFIGAAKFSPNGKEIAFVVTTGKHTEFSDLWIIDSRGKNKRKITRNPITSIEDISWNPDSKRILFTRDYPATNKQEIWSITLTDQILGNYQAMQALQNPR